MLTRVLQLHTRRVKNDISYHLHIITSTLYQRDFLIIRFSVLRQTVPHGGCGYSKGAAIDSGQCSHYWPL